MFRTPVQEGTIHCPNCNFLINIVQNQTDGATYAKHWTAREISKTHWRFILALLNGSLDFYCENKTKKEIIEHYSSSFGQWINNPARISEMVGIGVLDKPDKNHYTLNAKMVEYWLFQAKQKNIKINLKLAS